MNTLCKLKPASSRKTQLLTSALLWTFVGVGLTGFGLKWLIMSDSEWILILLIGALLVAIAKGNFILKKTAEKTIKRVNRRGDGTCLFGVFSVWQWLVVIAMMSCGRLLRTSGLEDEYLGAMYAAIGAALLVASSVTWKAYFNQR
jgi:hypothetical protein